MAKLLSELEKFEQEMKELGSDISPLTATAVPSSTALLSSSASSHMPVVPLPLAPVRPAVASPAQSSTSWLLNPGGLNASQSASTSSQFTYTTSVPFPPSSTSTASAPYFPVPIHLQQQNPLYQNQPYVQYQPQVQPTVVKPPQYTYQAVQQQQAQQLFQRDAQTITPEALESVKAALASGDNEHKAESKKRAIPRKAAGQTWEDPTLADWPENDYRLFCGDLGNEVNDEVLTKAFSRYTNFNMARVVRDKRTGKTKGYGFVSFSSPSDLALALKEMNGKYVGNRPIKLRKSTWKERTDVEALDKHKHSSKRPRIPKKNVLHK